MIGVVADAYLLSQICEGIERKKNVVGNRRV
jgi:hypothetical protein